MKNYSQSLFKHSLVCIKDSTRMLLVCFLIVALPSCTGTNNIATWSDSQYSNGPLKKIVVVGVFKNLSSRKAFEDEIAKRLNESSNTQAVASLQFLTPGVKYDHKTLEKIFTEKGFDGVLLVRTKSVQDRTAYIPERNHLVQSYQRIGGSFYHNVYLVTWKNVKEPGYFKDNFIVSVESSLFLNSNDKMIWTMEKSTQTSYRAEDGITSPNKESKQMGKELADKLHKAKLLLPKRG